MLSTIWIHSEDPLPPLLPSTDSETRGERMDAAPLPESKLGQDCGVDALNSEGGFAREDVLSSEPRVVGQHCPWWWKLERGEGGGDDAD